MDTRIALDTRKIAEIRTHQTFEQLFPIRAELVNKIEQDMREGKYDLSQPVILATWQGQEEPVCIDGHTRLKAAINAGIEDLPVWTHEFDSEQEAIEKAIKLQQNRRNLTDADITVCVAALDSRRIRGGDRRSDEAKSKASSDAIENSPSKSATETAELLGISTTKVERTRSLLNHGDPETIDEVKKGKKSINRATKEIREKRRKPVSDDNPNARETQAVSIQTDHLESVEEQTQSDLSEEQPGDDEDRTVSIPYDLYGQLKELGGRLEEHVERAIERYLYMLRAEQELEEWESDQEEFGDC